MVNTVHLEFAECARPRFVGNCPLHCSRHPQRARSFVNELCQQCTLLVEQPGLGVARPDLAEDLRQLPYERYLIFFSETDSGILGERVLHNARNLPQPYDIGLTPHFKTLQSP